MIKAVKAIGGNTDFLTAQAFSFIREDTCLTAIISASGEDVFTKVRIVGLRIEDDFFTQEGKPPENLKKTFEEVIKGLKGQTETFGVLLIFWQKNVLYLLSHGGHKAYLTRDDQVINLTDQASSGQLISGYLKENDKLLLVSQRASNRVWDDEFVNKLLKTEAEGLEDEVEALVAQSQTVEPIAAVSVVEQSEQAIEEQISDETVHPYPILGIASSKVKSLVRLFWQNRLARTVLGVSLILGSLILFGLSFYNQQKSETNSKFSSFLASAREEYALAQSLKDSDLKAAKLNWDQAQNNINSALQIKPKSSEAKNFKNELDQNKNDILKVREITNWPLFLSLDLIKKDFSASRMSYSLGKILFLDETQKTLVALELGKKTNQILSGATQLGQAQFSSLNGQTAFVYSLDKGILRVDLDNEKTTQIVKPDPEWGKITDLFAFSSNIYLMDSLKNQIWKYVPVKSGYADKAAYLKSLPAGRQIDLAGGNKLQIDYSVWVLKNKQEILKFTAGSTDFFSIGGLDKPLINIQSFFVSEKEDQVYILDPESSRVVVVGKNGQYQAQYRGEKFKSSSDLVVDDQNKKIYLLENNKIYTVDLK